MKGKGRAGIRSGHVVVRSVWGSSDLDFVIGGVGGFVRDGHVGESVAGVMGGANFWRREVAGRHGWISGWM